MLGIIGFIAIFVFAYRAYKGANEYGRNGIGWAAATFGVGFTLQIIIPFVIGLVLAIVYLSSGTPADKLDEAILWPAIIIGIIMLIVSIVAMMKLVSKASSMPDDDGVSSSGVDAPPPPPNFSSSNDDQ